MKLSVWSSYYVDLSPEDAVLEFEKYGFHHGEFSDEHSIVLMDRGEDAYETGKQFRAFAENHGMLFSQGHLLLHAKICDEKWIAPLKKNLDLFHGIGIQNAVLHCDDMSGSGVSFDEMLHRNVLAIRELADYAAASDITICLENGFPAEVFLRLISEIDRPNVGICLDTGHLNLAKNRNQAEFIQAVGPYLKALHLADNDESGDQHLMPFARGTVDFHEVITETKKIGYNGIYNLEIPGERQAPLAIRGYKLEYIKKMFAYLDEVTSA